MRPTDPPSPPPRHSPFEGEFDGRSEPPTEQSAPAAVAAGGGWRGRIADLPWWGFAILVLTAGWLFRDVLFRQGLLSFRDSLHFYYPLFDRIQQEWSAGRIPLWNPYSNAGEPLLASPTSSVFYPLKLVFFLPLSYWARYHLYVIGHVLLAGLTCGWVARRWGASRPAAALAGLSYACGGNVLFNIYNVVFLCGAAWLPIALWSGAAAMERCSLEDALLLAVALALMVLGGDPQLAYEAGMLVALYGALLFIRDRRSPTSTASAGGGSGASSLGAWSRNRLVLLGGSAVAAGLLAAIQILPTQGASQSSVRSAREVPQSLWEVPGYALRGRQPVPRPDTQRPPHWYDALVGDPPPPAKHPLQVYMYSFPPWRLIEFLWPNATGRLFSTSTRWGFLMQWEELVWVPSQYIGLWPLVFALAAFRLRKTDPRTRWLSLLVLISFLAAWGSFGPNWLLTQLQLTGGDAARIPLRLRGGIGGVYWLLTLGLPGFSDFRFPSKLLVLTSVGLSLLAAQGFDRLFGTARSIDPSATPPRADAPSKAVRWGILSLAAFSGLSLVMFVGLWAGKARLAAALETLAVERNTSFNAVAALDQIPWAFLQTAVVAGLGAAGFWLLSRRGQGAGQPGPMRLTGAAWGGAWLVVLGTAADLGLANSALIHTVDRTAWETTPALVRHIRAAEEERGTESPRPVRIARANDWEGPTPTPQPFPWSARVDWQRQSLALRQNLPFGLGVIFSLGSLDNREFEAWFDVLPITERPDFLAPRRSYDAWGTRYFVVDRVTHAEDQLQTTVGLRTAWAPAGSKETSPVIPLGPPLPPALGQSPGVFDGVEALYNDSAFPPAWIVHRIVPFRPIAAQDRAGWLPLMFSLVFPQENPIDLRTAAVVENDTLAAEAPGKSRTFPVPPSAAESCRVVEYASDRVEIEATLAAEGVVVLSDAYTADWTAEVSTDGGPPRPHPILRTNRMMRGLLLPAGTHRIRQVYRPIRFTIGALLSAAAWIGLAAGAGTLLFRRTREPRALPVS